MARALNTQKGTTGAESDLFPTAPGLGEKAKPGGARHPAPGTPEQGSACPTAQGSEGWVVTEPDSPLWSCPAEETPRPGSS